LQPLLAVAIPEATSDRILKTPDWLGMLEIQRAVGSLNQAVNLAASLTGRVGAATNNIIGNLGSTRRKLARALRAGRLPSWFAAPEGLRIPETARAKPPAPTTANFDDLADGQAIGAAPGAQFGTPTDLGFPSPAPNAVCPAPPTAIANAGLAASAPIAALVPECELEPGLFFQGVLVRFTRPAKTIQLVAGARTPRPSGYGIHVTLYDALGNEVGTNSDFIPADSPDTHAPAPMQVTAGTPATFAAVVSNVATSAPGYPISFDDLRVTPVG
jgi:hypothetical protein